MIDTYLMADSFDALATFCASFRNVIGPARGRGATLEKIDEGGNVVPAQAAAGDPAKFYACIRAPVSVPISPALSLAEKRDCEAVCGVWA